MTNLRSFAAAILCLSLSSQFAVAHQFDPARNKSLGEAMQGHQHAAYQQAAQARAQIIYYNAQSTEPTPVAETKEMVVAIRKDLKASDSALAKLKAAHAKEPEVVKQIALIEKYHAKAHEACGMAEEACAKEHADQTIVGSCCSTMWHELDAAQVETQKLLKMLKIEKLEPPKKVETVKPAA